MKKSIAWILTILMMLGCLAGCGSKAASDSDAAYVKKNGKLIVGITDYAPMDYKDESGEWTGFDAEFARLFAEELGVECEFFVIADWGQKFFELDSKNIDAIWNGMTITDEVTLNTNCSNPYVVNAQVVVMKADAVGNYPDADSLMGLTFAVESGSAGEAAIVDLGITDYVAVQDQAKAVMEVSAGTADACVIDITMANAMTGEGTSYDDLASGISLTSEEYGVGFRKGSDLTDAFNKFMDKCIADGTLQALADKYSLTLAG
ncbi:MAG: transporter substrate-binding domain-containing protein [Faecousia sp.]